MAKVIITESYLEDIADAIRTKTGSSDTYNPSEMAPAILSISGGGGITPTGTISIDSNGTYNVTSYASAVVAVPTGSTINNQNKTVTPTEQPQSITYDSGYTGLGTVTVEAISSTYIGSGITQRSSTDLTTSGATVTVPSGYYGAQATKSVSSLTLPTSTSSTISSGYTKKATISRSTSTKYLNIGTGYNSAGGYYEISAIPDGTAGTPTATKGTVSSNSITVTPSVTNTTGYITGSTINGTAVTVSASELVSGNKSITANGTGIDVTNYATVSVSVSGGTVNNQDKSVTPTTSQQTVTYDSGYTGLGTVTVDAMPEVEFANDPVISYSARTGSIRYSLGITTNGYVSGESIISSFAPSEITGINAITSDITITPTESQQTAATYGDFCESGQIIVNGISSTYIGSGITQRSSTDLSASGATVTVPSGYYSEQATKSVSSMTLPTSAAASATSGYTSKATISRSTSDQYINIPTGYNSAGAYYKISAVANGSVTGPSSLSGSSASISTGTNTLTLTKTGVTTTPTVSAGYVSSATASTATVTLTASVTTKAATTYNTSSTDQTISSGTYLTGTQTIKAVTVSGLSADKILSGTTVKIGDANDDDRIASVSGSVTLTTVYTGSSAPSSSLGSNNDIYIQS